MNRVQCFRLKCHKNSQKFKVNFEIYTLQTKFHFFHFKYGKYLFQGLRNENGAMATAVVKTLIRGWGLALVQN